MERNILVTGDYWHRDFKPFLAGVDRVTLTPVNRISSIAADQQFDLIVLAQSQPDQIAQTTVEQLQTRYPLTPIVAVLGSWCEGELRTGKPWPGVLRIYWHQWQGRFDTFMSQMDSAGISTWHAPRTSTTADRFLRLEQPHPVLKSHIRCVGVSTWTISQFEMLRDAIEHFGWTSCWIERALETATTSTPESSQAYEAILIEAESLSTELNQRIQWLQSQFPTAKLVVVANFPRENLVQRMNSIGVSAVVSKPFELQDLRSALERCARVLPAVQN